jgi:hypothetical protein
VFGKKNLLKIFIQKNIHKMQETKRKDFIWCICGSRNTGKTRFVSKTLETIFPSTVHYITLFRDGQESYYKNFDHTCCAYPFEMTRVTTLTDIKILETVLKQKDICLVLDDLSKSQWKTVGFVDLLLLFMNQTVQHNGPKLTIITQYLKVIPTRILDNITNITLFGEISFQNERIYKQLEEKYFNQLVKDKESEMTRAPSADDIFPIECVPISYESVPNRMVADLKSMSRTSWKYEKPEFDFKCSSDFALEHLQKMYYQKIQNQKMEKFNYCKECAEKYAINCV